MKTWNHLQLPDRLLKARNIKTNLASTNSAAFDGSADITPGVTGILPAVNGGTGNTTGTAQYLTSHPLTGVDLNTVKTDGFYNGGSGNNCTNKPVASIDYFGLIVFHNAGTYICQIMSANRQLYVRYFNAGNNEWVAWTQLYSTLDKPTASDVGAVPTARKVNNKALSSDISLTASDIGALPIAGGTLNGALNVGAKLNLRTDGEGGNIRFIPPDDKMTSSKTNYWELDAYDGGFRVFRNGSDSSNFNGFKITPAGLFETPGFTDAMVKRLFLATHPVGSYYWSSNATSPQTLFGGTWTQVKDRFVLAAGNTYKVGNTGGAASVTSGGTAISINQMPVHAHEVKIGAEGLASSISGGTGALTASNPGTNLYGAYATNSSHGYTTVIKDSGERGGNAAHTHSVSTLPPYIVAYCWRRTA